MDAELIARVAEDAADVVGEIAECIARPGPVTSAGVLKPAPVGVDEAAQQSFGMGIDER